MARSFWPTKELVADLNAPLEQRPNNEETATAARDGGLYATLDPALWELSAPSSSCRMLRCAATANSGENLTRSLHSLLHTTALLPSLQDFMAYQRADPTPFIPEGL